MTGGLGRRHVAPQVFPSAFSVSPSLVEGAALDRGDVSETDPFTDAAFTGRLQKLLPMLGSEQQEEADTARRKIGEHLAHYRLTFTDLAQHIERSRPGATQGQTTGSWSQGARELSLERQLMIARSAKEEAAREAESALHRVRVLEIELQQATFEIARTLNSQARVRIAAAVSCIVAVFCLIFVVLPHGEGGNPQDNNKPRVITMQPGGQVGDPIQQVAPGERVGRAAVQDLAIRLAPNDQADIRAFLNAGAPVVIQSEARLGKQTWLLIRSETGVGWVRSGDVLR